MLSSGLSSEGSTIIFDGIHSCLLNAKSFVIHSAQEIGYLLLTMEALVKSQCGACRNCDDKKVELSQVFLRVFIILPWIFSFHQCTQLSSKADTIGLFRLQYQESQSYARGQPSWVRQFMGFPRPSGKLMDDVLKCAWQFPHPFQIVLPYDTT